MKHYTLTGAQLRNIIKGAYWEGFNAARRISVAEAWEEADTRKMVDHDAVFEWLEGQAKAMVAK